MPDPTQVQTPAFPTNLPNIPAIADSGKFDTDVQAILATVPQAAPVTASPYAVSHDSTPNVHAPNIKPTLPMAQPMSGSAMDLKRARVHNNFASMQNILRDYSNKKEAEKFDNLKTEISTVMKAQQQIDNANSVLATDPNNAMAKGVLEQNKKVLESKLSNDKIRKEISKAFDVSFTDPSENNTPEIKAMQAAHKDIKAATAAGLDANTPAEAKVAQMHANGGNPPASQEQQANAAKASAPKQGVSYVDQFLKSQPASIGPNPEYATQLAAQQARDKQITQYVIPKLMDTYTKKAVEEIRQGNENTRAQYKGAIDYQNQLNKLANAAAIADAKNATTIKAQAMRDAASFRNAMLRANVALDVADAKGIKGTALAKKMQEHAMQSWNTMIAGIDKDNTEITAQIAGTKDTKGNIADQNKFNNLNHQLEMNNLTRRQAADERQKLLTKLYGTPNAGPSDEVRTGNTSGYLNATGKSSSDNSNKPAEVGGNASDSSEDSDDSEEERNLIEGFDIAGQ